MQSINFQTGVWREYAINGDEDNTIRVNLSDLNLPKRMEEIDAEAKALFAQIRDDRSEQMLAVADTKLRAMLDHVFGEGLSERAFGAVNVLSPNEDGECLFTAFCEAFGKLLREDAETFRKERTVLKPTVTPAVRKYLPPGSAALAEPSAAVPDVGSLTPEQKQALLRQLLT